MKKRSTDARPPTPSHRPSRFFRADPRRSGAAAAPPFFQAELRVGAPGDRFEQEADRVAERIADQGAMPAVREDEMQLQEGGESGGGEAGLAGRLGRSQTGGRPLPAPVRDEMGAAFGTDLTAVRVHTGDAAAEMSGALGANAFTHGRDIFFDRDRFAPDTREGRRLLAHELTHVLQQRGGAAAGSVQADFAVEPARPDATARTLSAGEITAAIAFNQRTLTDAAEIGMLRDILGLSPTPADIDADFVQAVTEYQALYNLTQDGKIGGVTRRRLSNEILAEARFLGFTDLGSLATGVELRAQLRALIGAGNTTYATYRARIRAASVLQRDVVLADQPTLRALRDRLPWDDFARCVELLGRQAPNHAFLIRQAVVTAALQAAWTASNPAVNPPAGTQHEEGGWVYLDLITNQLSVRRQAAGATAAINLASPPVLADNIVVAKFHTHPNLGPGWVAGPSPQDATVDAAHGVPDIVVGSNDVNPATFNIFASGPDRRAHLAGNQGLPGAGGGLAPQAKRDGSIDEQ